MRRRRCPECSGHDTTPCSDGWWTQLRRTQLCSDCGTMWRPSCPKRIATIYLVVGLIGSAVLAIPFIEYVAYFVRGEVNGPGSGDDGGPCCMPFVTLPGIGLCILTVVNALRVLIGQSGDLLVMKTPRQQDDVSANANN